MSKKFVKLTIFSEQNIVCPKVEPKCIESSEGIFFVGLTNGTIKCYASHKTMNNFNQIYEFNTIWSQVESIHYLPKLKRLVTIEKNEVQRVCRIYHLFWDEKRQITRIPVYTLPKKVDLISICKETNQILSSLDGKIFLWKFLKTDEFSNQNQQQQHIQIECILEIITAWNLKILKLHQNYICYGSENDFRVLKIEKEKMNKTKEIEFRFNKNTKNPEPSFCQNLETKHYEFDLLGESLVIDQKIKIVKETELSSVIHVLHKHFKKMNQIISVHFLNRDIENDFFETSNEMNLIINSSKKGYIYDLITLKLINEFQFDQESLFTEMNSTYFFSISKTCLEVYSIFGTSNGCLLRTIQYINVNSISATNSILYLLSISETTNRSDYNIYILNIYNFIEVYEEILDSAASIKQSNMKNYENLIQESHQMIKSKYFDSFKKFKESNFKNLNYKVKFDNYNALLQNSFGLVAKIEKDKQKAAIYFSKSNLDLNDILKEFENEDEYLFQYFKLILNKKNQNKFNQPISDLILNLFFKFEKDQLSKLILNQKLISYSNEHLISLLEKDDFDKGEIDWFLLFLLNLKTGKLEKSEKYLKHLISKNEEIVYQFFDNFDHLFKQDEMFFEMENENFQLNQFFENEKFKKIPTLGLFLRVSFPFIFLELSVRKKFSTEVTKFLLKIGGKFEKIMTEIFVSFLVLNQESNDLLIEKLMELMIEQLKTQKIEQFNDKEIQKFSEKFNFLKFRYSWLDEINNEKIDIYSKKRLQNIEVSKEILDEFICLNLLTLNKFEDKITLILDKQPNLMIDYSKEICKELKDWKFLLETIQQSQFLDIYERILDYLTQTLSNEDFLSLIPSKGNLDFFLPYIENCFFSNQTKENIDNFLK
eukprot:gene9842-2165_t